MGFCKVFLLQTYRTAPGFSIRVKENRCPVPSGLSPEHWQCSKAEANIEKRHVRTGDVTVVSSACVQLDYCGLQTGKRKQRA